MSRSSLDRRQILYDLDILETRIRYEQKKATNAGETLAIRDSLDLQKMVNLTRQAVGICDLRTAWSTLRTAEGHFIQTSNALRDTLRTKRMTDADLSGAPAGVYGDRITVERLRTCRSMFLAKH
jgi:hypothetical protein